MTDPTTTDTLVARLAAQFGEHARITEAAGQATLEVAAGQWLAVAATLRNTFGFEQLIDLCGVDYLGYGEDEWDTADVTTEGFSRGVEGQGPGRFSWGTRPESRHFPRRFAVVVHLLSISRNERVRLRCHAPDDTLPVVPSLTGIWPVANWFEREAFDLFGIVFEGHPDLRRILTDYGFIGHPFRKDFPLIGNVEVRYDEEKGRVIYEPVTSVEPRVLVPRVIREDARYETSKGERAQRAGGG